jgi:hypothetical protein
MSRAILVCLLSAAVGLADTVTTSDQLSVNGSLVEMSNGVIQLQVSSRSGKELRWIPVSKVAAIEFNSTVFNAGGPPKLYGIKPSVNEERPSKKAAAPAGQQETIVLRGGQSKACRLLSIDQAQVHCEGAEYSRQVVLRILAAR